MKPAKLRRKRNSKRRCGACRKMREASHAMCPECQGTDVECASCPLAPWSEWAKKWEEDDDDLSES